MNQGNASHWFIKNQGQYKDFPLIHCKSGLFIPLIFKNQGQYKIVYKFPLIYCKLGPYNFPLTFYCKSGPFVKKNLPLISTWIRAMNPTDLSKIRANIVCKTPTDFLLQISDFLLQIRAICSNFSHWFFKNQGHYKLFANFPLTFTASQGYLLKTFPTDFKMKQGQYKYFSNINQSHKILLRQYSMYYAKQLILQGNVLS